MKVKSARRMLNAKRRIRMLHTMFAILLCVSLLGLGICDLFEHNYKTFALGCLYAVANILIFIVK